MSQRQFESTHWSVVLAAGRDSSPESRVALESLCKSYWYPLYAFVRRQEIDHATAQELTQDFFALLLEREDLRRVKPELGRFRSFLLASLKNFLKNQWDRDRAQKRGGGRLHFSLSLEDGARQFATEPSIRTTAEDEYQRQWALALLDQVRQSLRREFEQSNRVHHFDALSAYLTRDNPDSYRETAEKIGLTEGAVKVAVHRLRQRFGDRLREEIAHTVTTEEAIDDEIRELFQTLQRAY